MGEVKAGSAQPYEGPDRGSPEEESPETAVKKKGRKKATPPTPEQIAAMSDAEHARVCDELVKGYAAACIRMNRLPEEAEDAASAFITKTIDQQQEYKYNGFSRTRLWSIAGAAARNNLRDDIRDDERAEPMRRDYGRVHDAIQSRATNPLRNLTDKEVAARVRDALATLGEREQQVFFLWFEEEIEGEGITYEEIGERLGMPLETVQTHMKRARAKLRDELRDVWESRTDRDDWDHGGTHVPMSGLQDPNDDPVDKRFDNKYDLFRPPDRFYLRSGEEGEKKRKKKELEKEKVKEQHKDKQQNQQKPRRHLDE